MKIAFSRLSTKALAGLAQGVITASTTGHHTLAGSHPLLLEVIAQDANYSQVYSKRSFSGQGKKVKNADKARKEQLSNLKAFVGGYRRLPKMPYAADAARLYALLHRLSKGFPLLSYIARSAQMKRILTELGKPAPAQSLANLGLLPTVQDLTQAQTDFENLYGQQAEANAALRQISTATATRKNLEAALKAYFGFLEIMKNIAGWEGIYYDVAEHVKAAKAD